MRVLGRNCTAYFMSYSSDEHVCTATISNRHEEHAHDLIFLSCCGTQLGRIPVLLLFKYLHIASYIVVEYNNLAEMHIYVRRSRVVISSNTAPYILLHIVEALISCPWLHPCLCILLYYVTVRQGNPIGSNLEIIRLARAEGERVWSSLDKLPRCSYMKSLRHTYSPGRSRGTTEYSSSSWRGQ